MDNRFNELFGNNIRHFRKSKHLTQEMLSAKMQVNGCDITRSALAKIEVGQRHVYPDEIKIIKEILDISYDELFSVESNYDKK